MKTQTKQSPREVFAFVCGGPHHMYNRLDASLHDLDHHPHIEEVILSGLCLEYYRWPLECRDIQVHTVTSWDSCSNVYTLYKYVYAQYGNLDVQIRVYTGLMHGKRMRLIAAFLRLIYWRKWRRIRLRTYWSGESDTDAERALYALTCTGIGALILCGLAWIRRIYYAKRL